MTLMRIADMPDIADDDVATRAIASLVSNIGPQAAGVIAEHKGVPFGDEANTATNSRRRRRGWPVD